MIPDPIKTFFVQFKIYFFIAIGVIILGQAYYIWMQKGSIEKKDLEYQILVGQHKNLAGYVGIQNSAIDKMKIDKAKAEKQFQTAKNNLSNKYDALVEKYKNTPDNKKCAIIIEQNRKEYEEDKGVGYEEN